MRPRTLPLSARPRIRLRVEILEDRLALSWGSVPPSSITPPYNYTDVSLDANGDASGSDSIVESEIDWRRFTTAASGTYVFDAATPNSILDTVAAVYNAYGVRQAYNDDSGGTTDSHFSVILTAGQTYFFGITNFTGTPYGTYTWKIDGPSGIGGGGGGGGGGDDAFEDNDTFAGAWNLGTLTAQQTWSGLKMADAADYFKFTMNGAGAAGNAVSIAFSNAQGDLDLRLYDSAGNVVGNSNGTGDSETISLAGLAAGTYTAQIYGYQGAFNPNYSLTINPGTGGGTGGGGGFQITLNISGMTASQRAIFQHAAARWAQVITGDLPNATYNGVVVDDVLIDASGVAIDGQGGILGQAGPDRFRSGSYLPYHGRMQFDTADLSALEASGGLYYVILHEMGHVLGVGTIWTYKGLLSGRGTSNPRFTGAHATAEYNALFHATATGVPVENTGGSGTRDAHWRESTFNNELMTGWLNSGVNPMSRVTVASLWDLGYTVNMAGADGYTPPGGGSGGGSGSGSGGGSASLRAALASAKKATDRLFVGVSTAFTPSVASGSGQRALAAFQGSSRTAAATPAGFQRPSPSPELEMLFVDEFSALFSKKAS